MKVRFTDQLQQEAGDAWTRVVNHRFTKELAQGTIDTQVIRRYLIQDYRFLDAFVVLLASIVAHCRKLSDRIPGCQFLAMITSKENTYFERSFERLPNCALADRQAIPNAACADGFINLMHEASRSGDLSQMLAVIVVCEWTYMTWGEAVKDETVRDNFICYEWVDLHSGPDFAAVVDYLRGLLDAEEAHLDEAGKEACKRRFIQTVQLEEDFFDYAYSTEE
jgi:thiaminase (transcriptional activator TenA)